MRGIPNLTPLGRGELCTVIYILGRHPPPTVGLNAARHPHPWEREDPPSARTYRSDPTDLALLHPKLGRRTNHQGSDLSCSRLSDLAGIMADVNTDCSKNQELIPTWQRSTAPSSPGRYQATYNLFVWNQVCQKTFLFFVCWPPLLKASHRAGSESWQIWWKRDAWKSNRPNFPSFVSNFHPQHAASTLSRDGLLLRSSHCQCLGVRGVQRLWLVFNH